MCEREMFHSNPVLNWSLITHHSPFNMQVTVYAKPGCHLCDDALDILDRLAAQYDLDIVQINILDDMAVYEEYKEKIPVVEVEDKRFGRLVAPITEQELRAYVEMASRSLIPPPPSLLPPGKESAMDRFAEYIANHWLRMVCIALAIFVGIPWLAPIFAALGWWGLADPIYTAYALTCHQLPERAGTVFGYQVAFCFRNTAIYAGVLGFGMLYGLARDRDIPMLRPLRKAIPWWFFALLLLPLLADGLTHMLGVRDTMDDVMMAKPEFGSFFVGSQVFSLNWWLRIITGSLAGLGAVWFAFPRMARAVEQSEALRLLYKQASASRYQAVTSGS
jgi:uncharacterized membrane protein/glutaredoxin